MTNIEKLKPAWFDHWTDIPQWIAGRIGHVAAEWSVVERELEELVRPLLDADIQLTRIITAKRRGSSHPQGGPHRGRTQVLSQGALQRPQTHR